MPKIYSVLQNLMKFYLVKYPQTDDLPNVFYQVDIVGHAHTLICHENSNIIFMVR